MDEEITIINNNTRKEKIINFLKENKKKLIILFSIFISFIFIYFTYLEIRENKKIKIAEKYNLTSIDFISGNKQGAKNKFIEIINSKDKTYSPLALYFLIDNDIKISNEEINKLFDILIDEIKFEKEIKNLIIYKKALFNSEFETENNLLNILSPILNSKSVWKSHSLYLMAEYFYSKKEKVKSKEFFDKILNLEDGNMQIKQEAQKRIKRDFSE